jgi:hypothetical protein
VEAIPLASAPEGVVNGADLRRLPSYICYRAALLREKATYQQLFFALTAVLVAYFVLSRVEIFSLYGKLRQKEYILAPGVSDFTSASPQTVPDSYVYGAFSDFLSQLGNVNPQNINEQYSALAKSMSSKLRVQFELEARDWIEKVKRENITEILSASRKEIESNERGQYRAVAQTRTETYVHREYVGEREEMIEMHLALVPPSQGRQWFLEVTELHRTSSATFNVKHPKGGLK